MRTVVVTGGIASGKTTACELYKQCVPEAVFFDCDASVHDLLTNEGIKQRLATEFGNAIFTSEKEVDRPRLGNIVFADAEKRKVLEGVLHPEVLKKCLAAKEEASETGRVPLFLADVPLFYEVDFSIEPDEVIVIAASRDLRLRRLRERAGLDFEAAERLLAIQMPLEEKIARADRVIWNEGQIGALRKQVHFAALMEVDTYGK
jgi:dephospho-CoA kinase